MKRARVWNDARSYANLAGTHLNYAIDISNKMAARTVYDFDLPAMIARVRELRSLGYRVTFGANVPVVL